MGGVINTEFFSNPLVIVGIGVVVVGWFLYTKVMKGGGGKNRARSYRRSRRW